MTQRIGFKHFKQVLAATGCVLLAGLAAGCGGGGGGSSGGGTIGGGTGGGGTGGGGTGGGGTSGPVYTPGVFEPSSEFVDQCAMPRPGTSDTQGSITLENFWLRSWSNEIYLWYDEIQDRDPGAYNDTLTYFDLLRTTALTPSGNPKDQFHYTYDTEEYQQLVNSGTDVQYGAEFVLLRSAPPRDVRAAFVQAGSSAGNAGIARGTKILEIDGVDVTNGSDVDTLNNGLFPSEAGETHTFLVQDLGSSATRQVTLTAQVVAVDPVQEATVIDEGGDKIGYLHLTTFGVVAAEQQLIAAMTDFANAGVDDLVIDLRYNGGGFLDISSELGYMVAGPNQIGSDFYEELVFNDKHPTLNPFTGAVLTPTPFHSTSQGFSVNAGQALPDLDLQRVFILSTGNTCSASEALINALRGIDVEVVLIGSTTCGKPYGFYAVDNCGTTYFTIQFRGENAKGFGDYADGFSPASGSGVAVTGCSVSDDFGHLLGDPDEAMLSTALSYRSNGTCGSAGSAFSPSAASIAPWGDDVPELFLTDDDAYRYIDPQSLYASETLRDRLRAKQLRELILNRPGAGADEGAIQ